MNGDPIRATTAMRTIGLRHPGSSGSDPRPSSHPVHDPRAGRPDLCREPDEQQRDHDGPERDRVGRERPTGGTGDESDAGQRRTYHPPEVELGGGERDGREEILSARPGRGASPGRSGTRSQTPSRRRRRRL